MSENNKEFINLYLGIESYDKVSVKAKSLKMNLSNYIKFVCLNGVINENIDVVELDIQKKHI